MFDELKYGAYAFLFNADELNEDGAYGYMCDQILFDSVLKNNDVYSRIYSGDLLLYNLCQQICEVKKEGNSIRTSKNMDKELYITLIAELVQSVRERYNTILAKDFYELIAKHNIYSVILTNYGHATCANTDKLLRHFGGYIGVFELDMGNPLHVILFLESMISHGYLKHNKLYLEDKYGEGEEIIPDWARKNSVIDVKVISCEDFVLQAPPLKFSQKRSFRGERFCNIVMLKGKEDHYQKICVGLIDNEEEDFRYTVDGKLSYDKIVVPEEKFVKYALDFEHEKGGKEKAKLFQDLLGITKKNWRYLAAQIENGIEDGKLCNVRQTIYGIQYHIDIPVKGINGVSKTVRTAWIAKEDTTISLVTLYIVGEKEQQDIEGRTPHVVEEKNQDDFWSVLYDLAHSEAIKAADRIVPTPMFIDGYIEPVMEGMCGNARIVIKDARKQFVRWLKSKDIGYHGYKGDWIIWAKTKGQSYERAKAYAETFAKILLQNGVDCYPLSHLD